MKEEIFKLIQTRQDVTFIELCREIPGFADPGPDGVIITAQGCDNIILWAGVSRQARDALAELEAAGRITQHSSDLWPYAIDGGGLNLDIAKKGRRQYKRPRWRPVTWNTTGRPRTHAKGTP